MVLVPVTAGNVEAYVAFLFEESDADGREYMATVDVRGFVLARGRDRFYLEDGAPAASLTVSRTPRHDGSVVVSVSILPRGGRAGPLLACLGEFLAGEEKTGPAVRATNWPGRPTWRCPRPNWARSAS